MTRKKLIDGLVGAPGMKQKVVISNHVLKSQFTLSWKKDIWKKHNVVSYKIEYDIISLICMSPIQIILYYRRQYLVKWTLIQGLH